MRVRALTLILLVAAWMVPAAGWSCPSNEAPGHVHGPMGEAASHPHADAAHVHGNAHDAATGGHSDPTRDTPSDDPTCCEHGPEAAVVQAVLKDGQARPKLSTAVLPTTFGVTARRAASTTGAQLRRRQPPPLPFARTRRPLLI